jgi:hypothetical protein
MREKKKMKHSPVGFSACPQGLKPSFRGVLMSELKLRPPKNHLRDGLQIEKDSA